MDSKVYEGVEIDFCPIDHGTWLVKGELRKIILNRRARLEKAGTHQNPVELKNILPFNKELNRRLPCPICEEQMPPFSFRGTEGVFINICEKDHGLWLDQSEMAKIQYVVESWRKGITRDSSTFSKGSSKEKVQGKDSQSEKASIVLKFVGRAFD